MGHIYYKDYEIHYYEVDYRKKLLFTGLIDYLGDIANWHSQELGVGIEYLKEKKLSWVLYSWDITVDRFPLFGEKITIKTEPTGFRKFYAFRSFEFMDSSGNTIGRAYTVWLLIDAERRRPIRITQELFDAYQVDTNGGEESEIFKLEKLSRIDEEKIFSVRYSDIDTNQHVNNSKYVAWAIETVPMDIILNYTIKKLKVNYEKETRYGETVKSVVQITKNDSQVTCLHKITDSEENELTLLETVWEAN